MLERTLAQDADVAYVKTIDLACSEEGKAEIVEELRQRRPERVVVAACSPRDHEETFRTVLDRAGMNPFLVQMANVREQAAWVTSDVDAATRKALALVRAAVARVTEHEPLKRRFLDVSTDVLVIGGGPAGLQAALTLLEAGRRVMLVEKSPILGGLPVRCEELFPKLECAPCVLEPLIAEALRGAAEGRLELLLVSQLESVVGSFGNFVARLRRAPRGVDVSTCVGCMACIEACPATLPNPVNGGRGQRKAMDFVFFGGLPNAPHIEYAACLRSRGEPCELCREACPVEGAVRLDDPGELLERRVGAIVVAVGGGIYDPAQLEPFGYGLPDVFTSLEFERLLAANGPTQGAVRLDDGRPPTSIAVVHCAASLDTRYRDYCSGVCCLEAFKFNAMLAKKLPGVRVTHYARTFVASGKDEARFMREALLRDSTRVVTHGTREPLRVEPATGGRKRVSCDRGADEHDLVVLMPPLVPSTDSGPLAARARHPLRRERLLRGAARPRGRHAQPGSRDLSRRHLPRADGRGPCDDRGRLGGRSGAGGSGARPAPRAQAHPRRGRRGSLLRLSHLRRRVSLWSRGLRRRAAAGRRRPGAVRGLRHLRRRLPLVRDGRPRLHRPPARRGDRRGARMSRDDEWAAVLEARLDAITEEPEETGFEPKVVAFVCNWCAYAGADKAGAAQLAYPANVRLVRVMCSGRVDAQHVVKAFDEGADGVLVLACHPGDCHYKEQNLRAVQRHRILLHLLRQSGIEAERCRLDFVSAAEGEKLARVAGEIVAEVKRLGPLRSRRGPGGSEG